jgi:acyl-CoA synthetase (AMP-forming)/AMP-acid ligase II/thioesterase domain-containing protein
MPLPSFAAIDAISSNALANAKFPALIEPNGILLSYFELWARMEAVSSRLQDAGIRFGERVAVLLPQGALEVIAVAGVLNRHVCLPLKAKTTVIEVESALRRCSASALITSSEFAAEAESAAAMGLTVFIARHGESPRRWESRAPSFPHNRTVAQSEAILFLITSATTSDPKIVPLTTANLNAGNASTYNAIQLTDTDRLLLMVPLCHRIGFESAFAQFRACGTVIATNGFVPANFVHWLNELKPSWYACAPTVHQAALLQLRKERPADPFSLRVLQSAGAPLANDVRDELETVLRVPVLNGYGATEAHYIALESVPHVGHFGDAAGRACGSEIGIMTSSGKLLPVGEDGEIVARGAAVFSGYLDDPDADRRAFQDGWFRTGDLGRLDQDGNLYVTGRLKEMINRGGEKIAPAEVDAALASHPAVLEAAAFAVPHPTLGEEVACAVVLRQESDAQPSVFELRRHMAERLAPFKVPHRIHFVDQIPRGELGKPQRWVLEEQLRKRHGTSPTPAELTRQVMTDGLIVNLHEIWQRILERDDLSFDEDFFDAGGDSLAAINMLAEVDQRFRSQTGVTGASFIDEPTLANLASLIRRSPPGPAAENSSYLQIFPVRTGECGTQLFCVPEGGAEGFCFRRLAKHLSGKMDLSIIRPANTNYDMKLFCFERAGKEMAELIRRAQPDGPYFVCGYCFGGVVAFEAARRLSLLGQDVRVILFEVPMPGSPGFVRDWRIWAERAKRQWYRLWTCEHPGLTRNLKRVSPLLAWSALVPLRRFLASVENAAIVRRMLNWVEGENMPLYKVRPLDAPFLHILSTDDLIENDLRDFFPISRFGWRRVALRGIAEKYVAFDHINIFQEANLPVIADTIYRWCGVSEPIRELNTQSIGKL